MKRSLKYIILILLGFLFVWTLWFLYQKSVTKEPEYTVVKPKVATIVKKTVANGTIEPRQEIDIKPVVSGVIRQLFVEAGQKVKEGDKLATIQIVPDMLSLNQAESRVNSSAIAVTNAQLNFDRNKPLADKGVISASEMQTYDIALRNAKQEQSAAQDALQLVRDGISKSSSGSSNTIVRSTINGMVLDVPVKVGSSVIERNNFNEGTTIATVADMKDLIFKGNVDESEVGKVRLGMPVVITVGAIDSASWDANLEYIAPKGVEVNGAIQFEIRAAVNVKEGQTLRAGYSANADIVLDRRDSVLTIPESVISFSPKGDSAFVEVKNQKTWDKTFVRTGLSDGVNIELLGGISDTTSLKGALKVDEPKK
ncbi:MAG: efflux RND transporter periplasmic adaptor subunit [Flavobacteriales bacterium]|jgi:HlyD family secretion protein|nr:efflux RND transporter periplasmic adaptor subunit [Flavobacteriales bacterium]MCB0758254.1 efflux RND transporter periplasmic adaptor subunit [Flavobacteriales bacterium]